MGGSQQKHNWLQDKIYSHPEIIGISHQDIICKAKEYELRYKTHILTVPDLYYNTKGTHNFVEIKSDNNHGLYSKGMSQLEKIALWADMYDIKNFDAKLVMPFDSDTTLWINMLDNLKTYKLGDSYDKYTNNEGLYQLK